jgi:hypothetical protein
MNVLYGSLFQKLMQNVLRYALTVLQIKLQNLHNARGEETKTTAFFQKIQCLYSEIVT